MLIDPSECIADLFLLFFFSFGLSSIMNVVKRFQEAYVMITEAEHGNETFLRMLSCRSYEK